MGNYQSTAFASQQTPPNANRPHLRAVSNTNSPNSAPGGVFKRLCAVVIDGVIVNLVTFPLNFGAGMLLPILGISASSPEMAGQASLIGFVVSLCVTLPVSFVYYGWFYSNKGATPGKLVLGLRVVDAKTGTNLGYWRAFLREVIGRIIDIIPLMAGLFVGLIRSDKRCFHDLIAGSQVITKK